MDYSKYCSLTYNNKLLDSLVPGYTTINVEGRGLLNRSLTTVDIPGRSGQRVANRQINSRNIRVHFLLKAERSQEFMQRLHLLHEYLESEEDVVFQFGDESYFRRGQVSEMEDPPYDQLQGVGTFTIFCQDPYKYDEQQQLEGNPTTLISDTSAPIHPDLIEIKFRSSAEKLIVSNMGNGKRIIINDAFVVGDIVKIKIKEGKIEKNLTNIMNKLDYAETDWNEFVIRNKDKIQVTPINCNMKITYRRKFL